MVKFFIVTIVIWFIIFKLLRFKFIVYKGPSTGKSTVSSKREGTINLDKSAFKSKGNKSTDNGEYVDYEEVR